MVTSLQIDLRPKQLSKGTNELIQNGRHCLTPVRGPVIYPLSHGEFHGTIFLFDIAKPLNKKTLAM